MPKILCFIFTIFTISGCASTPGSFAYEVANASERSKYTRDTIVTAEQMETLDITGDNLEKRASGIKFNDAGFTYGFGQAADAATMGAIAGSAAGLLDVMSGLDMAMFGAMAIFDNSHAERRKLYLKDAFILREQKTALNNTGKKGFIQDINDIAPHVDNAINQLAANNGWSIHPSWASGNAKQGLSTGYIKTGICGESQVLTFFSRTFEKTALEKGYGTAHGQLEGERIGSTGERVFNVTGFGLSPWCAPDSGIQTRRELTAVPTAVAWPLVMSMSTLDEIPKEIYFYLPASENAFPVPALVNQGKVYWMATVK